MTNTASNTSNRTQAKGTASKRDHELTGDNIYIRKDNGGRVCRQCKRGRDRAYKQAAA